MNIFFAELSRLLSRRLLTVLFGLVVIGFAVAGVVVFVNASPGEAQAFTPSGRLIEDQGFELVSVLETAEDISGFLILLFVLIGAMAIGAEWPNRSITMSLTFEPRRNLLLGSKLASVAVVAFGATLLLELILLLFLLPAAFIRGTTEGVDAAWWVDYFGALARAGFVAAFGATLGLSIATIGRNTGAALGVAFLYFAILEQLLRVWQPGWAEWLIGDNMGIVASGSGEEIGYPDRTAASGAIVLLIYGAVIYVSAQILFKRRDIG
jgi:ABC-type transport system involved in multi-copper enzyme maturation permease subunit